MQLRGFEIRLGGREPALGLEVGGGLAVEILRGDRILLSQFARAVVFDPRELKIRYTGREDAPLEDVFIAAVEAGRAGA